MSESTPSSISEEREAFSVLIREVSNAAVLCGISINAGDMSYDADLQARSLSARGAVASRLDALLTDRATLMERVAELEAELEAERSEIESACDAGMRLSLPPSEIVGRIRAALGSTHPGVSDDGR